MSRLEEIKRKEPRMTIMKDELRRKWIVYARFRNASDKLFKVHERDITPSDVDFARDSRKTDDAV